MSPPDACFAVSCLHSQVVPALHPSGLAGPRTIVIISPTHAFRRQNAVDAGISFEASPLCWCLVVSAPAEYPSDDSVVISHTLLRVGTLIKGSSPAGQAEFIKRADPLSPARGRSFGSCNYQGCWEVSRPTPGRACLLLRGHGRMNLKHFVTT